MVLCAAVSIDGGTKEYTLNGKQLSQPCSTIGATIEYLANGESSKFPTWCFAIHEFKKKNCRAFASVRASTSMARGCGVGAEAVKCSRLQCSCASAPSARLIRLTFGPVLCWDAALARQPETPGYPHPPSGQPRRPYSGVYLVVRPRPREGGVSLQRV